MQPSIFSITTQPIPKKNTTRSHLYVLEKFSEHYAARELQSITTDEILTFLNQLTAGNKQTTKSNRYSNLRSFFNFVINTFDTKFQNPFDAPALRKLFKELKPQSWPIIEKDVVDEIVFRITKPRNRLLIERQKSCIRSIYRYGFPIKTAIGQDTPFLILSLTVIA